MILVASIEHMAMVSQQESEAIPEYKSGEG